MKVNNIFIHCSASAWGDVLAIRDWHVARGWRTVGYHFVILNGKPKASGKYWALLDGTIQPGRSIKEMGAHVGGRNPDSLGICLIGKRGFTDLQLESTKELALCLTEQFDLTPDDVLGHYEDPNTQKTCPNIPMDSLRKFIKSEIDLPTIQLAIAEHIKTIYK